MDHSYSTSEMCSILGVGRDTLRHYENMGLLKPQVNKDNGYRMYGYWDVATMIDVLKYRSMELSIKDIQAVAHGTSYDDFAGYFGTLRGKYQDQIKRYQMLDKKLECDLKYLQSIHGNFNKLVDMIECDFYFLPYHKLLEEMKYDVLNYIFSNSQFFTTAWHITGRGNETDPRYYLGFITEKEFADYLEIGNGYEILQSVGIGMPVDLKGYVTINRDTVKDFEEKALAAYPNLGKDTYAILLSRFLDPENVLHQYVFMFKKFND